MKPNRKKRLLRGGISAALAVVLAFSVPSSSWAYWSASASPQNPTLSAAVVLPPASVSCSSSGVLLFRRANVSWTSVPGATYNVIISNADGSISGQKSVPTNEIALSGEVLNNLLGGLVAVLFGSGTANVAVQTVHPSGWISKSSEATVPIGRSGLLIDGLLGGVECK